MQEQKKNGTWGELEDFFATAVIAQAQRNTKRWFTAWLVTAVALLVSNAMWFASR